MRFPNDYEIKSNNIFNNETYKKILKAVYSEQDSEAVGYAISLYTGMRIGEICALQWKDIDLENKVICVSKTLQRIYFKNRDGGVTKMIIGIPKSKNAIREIPISKALEELLNKHNNVSRECYLLSGNLKYVEPRLYRKHFDCFFKRNGLEHIRFHDLRHTFSTNCIEKGADCKTVSSILGHSSISITLNRYVHPKMELKRKCVELL